MHLLIHNTYHWNVRHKQQTYTDFLATYLQISGLFAIRRKIIVCFFCGEVVYMNYWSERERERGCVRRQRGKERKRERVREREREILVLIFS